LKTPNFLVTEERRPLQVVSDYVFPSCVLLYVDEKERESTQTLPRLPFRWMRLPSFLLHRLFGDWFLFLSPLHLMGTWMSHSEFFSLYLDSCAYSFFFLISLCQTTLFGRFYARCTFVTEDTRPHPPPFSFGTLFFPPCVVGLVFFFFGSRWFRVSPPPPPNTLFFSGLGPRCVSMKVSLGSFVFVLFCQNTLRCCLFSSSIVAWQLFSLFRKLVPGPVRLILKDYWPCPHS